MKGVKPELREDPEAITNLAAPGWMGADARAEWERVMPILSARRILSAADLGGLENYCIAIGTAREAERIIQVHGLVTETESGLKRNPAVGIQSEAIKTARLIGAEMGLTPVSRSRPAIRDDEEDDDPFDLP